MIQNVEVGKMKICICDSDKYLCDELIKIISECFFSVEAFSVRCYYSPEEMFINDDYKNFDVYFIDADKKGAEIAEVIRSCRKDAIIVLSGNSDEHIFDAFMVEALYFLRKPINRDELAQLFRRILTKYQSLNPSLILRWKNERHIIKIPDIIYIEGYNRHLTFYTKHGEFSSVGKIQNIYEKLLIHGFMRVHQGYTVNMHYVKHFNNNEVIMFDGTKVMISTRRRTEALKIYDEFLKNI